MRRSIESPKVIASGDVAAFRIVSDRRVVSSNPRKRAAPPRLLLTR
jgi:hypothetical protein